MQKIMVGLALMTSLSVFAKTDKWPKSRDEIEFQTRQQIQRETDRLRCSHQYMREFLKLSSSIRKVKLELVAEALCSNEYILHQFRDWQIMDKYAQTKSKRELVPLMEKGRPLLLALYQSSGDDLKAIIQALQYSLFPGEHNRLQVSMFDLTGGVRPFDLDPSRTNILMIDIDQWIADKEITNRGDLLNWLGKILEVKGSTVTGFAIAKNSPDSYASAGYPEVADFLRTFKQIHFDSYPPNPRDCQEYL